MLFRGWERLVILRLAAGLSPDTVVRLGHFAAEVPSLFFRIHSAVVRASLNDVVVAHMDDQLRVRGAVVLNFSL